MSAVPTAALSFTSTTSFTVLETVSVSTSSMGRLLRDLPPALIFPLKFQLASILQFCGRIEPGMMLSVSTMPAGRRTSKRACSSIRLNSPYSRRFSERGGISQTFLLQAVQPLWQAYRAYVLCCLVWSLSSCPR